MFNYWRESLVCALDEAGAFGVLTDAQIDIVSRSLMTSAENASTASGADCIPNPLHAEIDQLKRDHARLEKELREDKETARREIARVNNVRDDQVIIAGGRVEIWPR